MTTRAERRRRLRALEELRTQARRAQAVAVMAQRAVEESPTPQARAFAHEASVRAFALAGALKMGEAMVGKLPK